ncbi:MAG: hypothetical protein ABWZ77_01415 [Naasia sp.]
MTQTFPAWLADQTARDDDTGEFARQIADVGDFPDSGGRAIFEGYFATTLDADRERFERAWTEFEASPEPSPTSERPDGF